MKPTTGDLRWIASAHESAHTVVSRALRWPVHSVQVSVHRRIRPYTTGQVLLDGQQHWYCPYEKAVILHAGLAGEDRAYADTPASESRIRPRVRLHAQQDHRMLTALPLSVPESSRAAADAAVLVRDYWRSIVRVAEALMQAGSLTTQQLDEILLNE